MKKKKGFTLIELLAIIVILAIIAVITVPIILNIIENARKGAAQNSAHGYKDAVSKFMVTEFSKDSNYTIPNGTYDIKYDETNPTSSENGYLAGAFGELGVQITGQTPQSGYFDIEDNIIKNGCVKFGDYAVNISEGKVGTAIKGDCRRIAASTIRGISKNIETAQTATNPTYPVAFQHEGISAENSVTGTKIASTIDYRYTGTNPYNYILFNCSDYSNPSTSTCELWRIIDVEGDNLKIIKSDPIGNLEWNSENNNDWSVSTLKNYLNGSNYAPSNGLIESKDWYLGGNYEPTTDTKESYKDSRTKTINGNAGYINAKVGLMYPSDFGYASLTCSTGEDKKMLFNYDDPSCSNWLQTDYEEWLITASTTLGSNEPVTYKSNVLLATKLIEAGERIYKKVRPVVYLIENIGLSGTGTTSDPYTIIAY